MIASDQPTIFGASVKAAVSSVSDGNMRFGRGDDEETFQNRLAFLHAAGIDPEHTTLVQVTYDNPEHFARYEVATDDVKGEGMFAPKSNTIADALVVTRPGHALFLPLADCAGLILYDETQGVLMVSHVGRHSAEIDGAKLSVEYLQKNHGVLPANLKVWVSPAVGKATYPLKAREGKSLHEVIGEQLLAAGVLQENTEFSAVDTAQDHEYFSHSQFLAGNRDMDGRFAIVAEMRQL